MGSNVYMSLNIIHALTAKKKVYFERSRDSTLRTEASTQDLSELLIETLKNHL